MGQEKEEVRAVETTTARQDNNKKRHASRPMGPRRFPAIFINADRTSVVEGNN